MDKRDIITLFHFFLNFTETLELLVFKFPSRASKLGRRCTFCDTLLSASFLRNEVPIASSTIVTSELNSRMLSFDEMSNFHRKGIILSVHLRVGRIFIVRTLFVCLFVWLVS